MSDDHRYSEEFLEEHPVEFIFLVEVGNPLGLRRFNQKESFLISSKLTMNFILILVVEFVGGLQ